MKNIKIKLAVTSAIVIASAILLVIVFNNPKPETKINIPPDLASMSVEELINLYYNPGDSAHDPNIIKIALQQAMDKTNPDKIVEIAKDLAGYNNNNQGGGFGGRGSRVAMESIAFANPVGGFIAQNRSFADSIEGTDLFVKARFLGLSITNADDIVQAIIDKMSFSSFDFSSKFRVKIELEVIDSLPKGSLEAGQKIKLQDTLFERQMTLLEKGGQYFFPMVQTDKGPRLLSYLNGVFQIDTTKDTTQADQLWKFYSDAQDILLFGKKPQQETVDFWTSLLNSDAAELAFAYMDLVSDEMLPAREIMDIIENRHNEVVSQIKPGMDYYQLRDTRRNFGKIEKPLKVLLRSNDKESLARLSSLLIKEDSFLELMNILPDNLIPTSIIMDAIERKYKYIMSEIAKVPDYNPRRLPQGDDLMGLADNAISLMLSSGDKDSMKRMLSLFEEDMENQRNGHFFRTLVYFKKEFVNNLVRLIIGLEDNIQGDQLIEVYQKYKDVPIVFETYSNVYANFTSTPEKAQRDYAHGLIVEIIEQSAKIANESVYSMLSKILEEPSAYSINDAKTYAKIWLILGSSGTRDMRSYLEEFIKSPSLSDIGYVEWPNYPEDVSDTQFDFEQAAIGILQLLPAAQRPAHKEIIDLLLTIYERHKQEQKCIDFVDATFDLILQKGDTECIPVLAEMLLLEKPPRNVVKIIQNRIPDPALIPAIKKSLLKKFDFSLVNLLYACGDKQAAIDYAMEQFRKPVREDTERNFRADLDLSSNVMLLIGKSGNAKLASSLDLYTDDTIIDNLRQIKFTDGRFSLSKMSIRKLQASAMMALARLKGKAAVAQLRKNYQNTKDIYIKLIAALSLYYLGDDTGLELLKPIVNNTYLQTPEIAIRVSMDLSISDVFQEPILTYLRSKRTDALLLEKLSSYLYIGDDNAVVEFAAPDYFSDMNYSYHAAAFCRDYTDQIIQILFMHLSSRDKESRTRANDYLKKLTGQDFGFDPAKYHGFQENIVQQWKDYLTKEYPSANLL
ncbi:MAG: hypothetical protein JW787_10465 [Sedimentisphaerales bacterium]|nr:hypothetical protein [Sedimentisphaerales bacterium]